MAKLRWGIVSAGNISHDFVNAVNDPSGPAHANNVVVAVAAQQLDRAKTFAENHGISTVYGSYDELAQNGDIDVVYVGNTTAHHYDVCKLMLEAGKHVLCEKAMTCSVSQTQELFSLATQKKRFLMEAVWSNFIPTYKHMKKVMDEGGIGKVTHLEASFGLVKSDTPRILSKEMGGGASLDLGVYLANLVRHTFNKEWPEEIIARGDLYPSGVESGWDVILVFKDDRRAVLKCSTLYELSNSARIAGSTGCMQIPGPTFYCTERVVFSSGEDFTVPLPNKSKNEYNYPNSAFLSYEAAAVSQAIRDGKLECSEYTSEDSLYIAKLLSEINRQIGSVMV